MGSADPPMTRIGVLVPSVNVVIEDDLRRVCPAGVGWHVNRVRLTGADEDELRDMEGLLPDASARLADAAPDAIAFACTAGSVIGGHGYDSRLCALIGGTTGLPATTTITAVLRALRCLGARRIAFASPYPAWLHNREADFLADNRFQLTDSIRLPLADPRAFALASPGDLAGHVRSGVRRPTDAVLLSCANIRALEAVPWLEDTLGVPVVTSNQALLWDVLHLVGHPRVPPSLGALATVSAPPQPTSVSDAREPTDGTTRPQHPASAQRSEHKQTP